MKKEKKPPYEQPFSICTVVHLENPICGASSFQVSSPHGGKDEIETQSVDTGFEKANDFLNNENLSWD